MKQQSSQIDKQHIRPRYIIIRAFFCSASRAFVETKEALPDFWAKGDVARVVGIGRTNAPVAVRFESGQSAGRLIDVQEGRFQRHTPALPQLPHPGWEDSTHVPSLPPTRPPSLRTDVDADADADADASAAADADADTVQEEESEGVALPHDYYELLGLGAEFSPQELRRAYRQASLRLHPDKPLGSREAFQASTSTHSLPSFPSALFYLGLTCICTPKNRNLSTPSPPFTIPDSSRGACSVV